MNIRAFVKKRRWMIVVSAFLLWACGGGGGGSEGAGDGGGGTPPPAATASTIVLAANDLGMHCMDREFSIFSILPPFNVINAQVIERDADGNPVLMDGGDTGVRYAAATDAGGSVNSYSLGKTDFWIFADLLFGTNIQDGEGLTGLYMPADDPQTRGAQPMAYSAALGGFSAEGVPITPVDDGLRSNPYPLMEIAAYSLQTGQPTGSVKIVVPVATETECRGCHRTGGVGSTRAGIVWAADADTEVQSKKNILKLHDALEGTTLETLTPVLCAGCHYSKALDLTGAGPAGAQVGKPVFSKVMHGYHGELSSGGQALFPDNISACYECHPGQITQCQRGAMRTGGMDCIDCHGGMAAVGGRNPLLAGGSIDGTNDGGERRPWQDLPRCQSCHTGDAVSHLSGAGLVSDGSGIRLTQTYRTGDASASPLLAVNKRFAEQDNTLYRFSRGHGGVRCENCHGSTHAEWPNAEEAANDNVAAKSLQGFSGKLIECSVCHGAGSLALTTNGPHGLHNVNDGRWVDERHGDFYENAKSGCKACHGTDLLGTPLARMPTARSFSVEGRQVNYARGDLVRCDRCHSRPGL
jgi:hypothetical protein